LPNILFDAIRDTISSPDALFIEDETGQTITYNDMLEQTARLANVLVNVGVKAGDRVAVQVEKSPEALIFYLACVRAGAVYLPLNMGYTSAEIEYFINDAKPALLVVDPSKSELLSPFAKAIGARIETLGINRSGSLMMASDQQSEQFEDIDRESGDLAAILYTSGTTGRSKGAMLTHENLVSNARTLKAIWQYKNTDKLLHALPIFHTHGLFVATNITLLAGASMVLLQKFDIDKIFALMARCTVMMGVPTFYARMVGDNRLTMDMTAGMRLFISGSAPLLAETHRSFTAKTGHAILERYGMTETNMITSNPYQGDRVAGTVGFALPGVDVRVVDSETGALVATSEPGMIEVRGPNVFVGYWNMPEKTKEEFRADGYFITGDIGTMDADGRVTIVGRGKDLIISGGYNIYPKEIENEIDALDGVVESAVIAAPHPDFGEAVVAVVVLTNTKVITADDIFSSLVERLARFKQPKHIAFVEDLPRNTMGKVQKNILREDFRQLFLQ
jgi:malonyl-CoA/methylmalonyl-CoA synthetase